MIRDRRLLVAAGVGLVLLLAAAASDFVLGSFWERHSLLASLVSSILVLAVTVVVINEVIERRDQQRWNLLAQSVLFALIQGARATWTGMVELLQLGEVQGGSVESLRETAILARDPTRVSKATDELLADKERRARLQRVTTALSNHLSDVIAKWAPVMVNARSYATVIDRHVELAGRLEWLSNVLTYNEPLDGQSSRDRTLALSSVATEHADELGTDKWLHEMIVSVITLATELDYQSREEAYSIVPMSWWAERTAGLTGSDSVPDPLR
jgi:hypothetical protein